MPADNAGGRLLVCRVLPCPNRVGRPQVDLRSLRGFIISEMADTSRGQHIRKKIPHFRILIMGRANAGKTTILQRVCKTTEAPAVIDGKGNKAGPRLYADPDEKYSYFCRSAFQSSKAHEKYVSQLKLISLILTLFVSEVNMTSSRE